MWYAVQLVIIGCVVYVYQTQIPHPNATLGHVVMLACLVAYLVTWTISKFIDLIYFLLRSVRNIYVNTRHATLARKKAGGQGRIERPARSQIKARNTIL